MSKSRSRSTTPFVHPDSLPTFHQFSNVQFEKPTIINSKIQPKSPIVPKKKSNFFNHSSIYSSKSLRLKNSQIRSQNGNTKNRKPPTHSESIEKNLRIFRERTSYYNNSLRKIEEGNLLEDQNVVVIEPHFNASVYNLDIEFLVKKHYPQYSSIHDYEYINKYWNELKIHGGVFRINDSCLIFRDFDILGENNIKLNNQYYHVIRDLASTRINIRYFCYCNRHRFSKDDKCIHSLFGTLLHVSVRRRLNIVNILTQPKHELFLDDEKRIFLISTLNTTRKQKIFSYRESHNKYYTVHQNNDNTIVCNCSKSKECKHKSEVTKALGYDKQQIMETKQKHLISVKRKNKLINVQSHSFRIIPVPKSYLKHGEPEDRKYYENDEKFLSSMFIKKFHLDYDSCQHCQAPFHFPEGYKRTYINGELFQLTSVTTVLVEYHQCYHCGERNYFDGLYHQVFNFNSYILIHHSVLNSYTDNQFYGMTCSWYVKISQNQYTNNGTKGKFITAPTFRNIWSCFIRHQAWGYNLMCPCCGSQPEYIVADGTMMTVSKITAQDIEPPTQTKCTVGRETEPLRGQYIADKNMREFYRRWSVGLLGYFKRDCSTSNLTPLDEDDEKVLFDYLYDNYEEVYNFSVYVTELCEEENFPQQRCYLNLKNFVRCIASDEPILQIFGSELVKGIESIIDKYPRLNSFKEVMLHDEIRELLSTRSSLISCLLFNSNMIWSNDLYYLLHDMYEKAKDKSQDVTSKRFDPINIENVAPTGSSQTDECLHTGCCYGTPKIRERPLYDREIPSSSKYKKDEEHETKCSKIFPSLAKQTGGILIIRCAKHSICVGFHVIYNKESLNDMFSAILCHWEKAPKVVIMDHACRLHAYCMIREGDFFKDTLFVIDEPHFLNHTRCSPAYNVKWYKRTSSVFSGLNDIGCEQRNFIINRTQLQATFSNLDFFVLCTRLNFEIDNRNIINKYYKLTTKRRKS